jgi:hypothetical protein
MSPNRNASISPRRMRAGTMGGSPSKSGSRCNTLTAANGDMLVLLMVGRGGSDPTQIGASIW